MKLGERKQRAREKQYALAYEMYQEISSYRKVGDNMQMSHTWVKKAIQKHLAAHPELSTAMERKLVDR